MSEEEKKAIDYFKNLDVSFNTLLRIDLNGFENAINTLLNLIEKQQKEIEEQAQVIDEMAKKLVDLQIPISQEEDIMILNYVKRIFYKKIKKK